MVEVSIDELKTVFADFYNLTKFKIVLYDSNRNALYTYPEKMCKFCETVRTNKILEEICFKCDNIGFDICDKTRKPYIYECHMSITEAIAPIYYNDINIGYLMFGQILNGDSTKIKDKAINIGKAYDLCFTDSMINEIIVADDAYINSAVSMMTMCANYLYTNKIIRNNPDIFAYQIKEYVLSHLDMDLTIKSICKHFYISQTKLYKISKNNFNMGISDFVRTERIKKAKLLLLSTNDSISQIAANVGIYDTNYFIRTFKQLQGTTPLQYRKNKVFTH